LTTVPTVVISATPFLFAPAGAVTFRGRSIPVNANDSPTGLSLAPTVALREVVAQRLHVGIA
ncbi:MAG TPA: hypothetical protein VK427_12140, partial [Kofleriaceae bacterium]|nr:hypothetical protein [Kofleriaceae bacterium]